MFAIINTGTREVQELLDERPKKGVYQPPLLSVYVTSTEASSLTLPYDELVPSESVFQSFYTVHHPGAIVPQAQLDAAVNRQDALKVQAQTVLTFAKSINGRSFSSLTTTELKGLLQLLFSMNGMVDINGSVDLSDFTVDDIIHTLR